jgi:hypothetical protein
MSVEFRAVKGYTQEVQCDRCKKLMLWGDGDLNCCYFVCLDCLTQEEKKELGK